MFEIRHCCGIPILSSHQSLGLMMMMMMMMMMTMMAVVVRGKSVQGSYWNAVSCIVTASVCLGRLLRISIQREFKEDVRVTQRALRINGIRGVLPGQCSSTRKWQRSEGANWSRRHFFRTVKVISTPPTIDLHQHSFLFAQPTYLLTNKHWERGTKIKRTGEDHNWRKISQRTRAHYYLKIKLEEVKGIGFLCSISHRRK
jgi:hypothetical protein